MADESAVRKRYTQIDLALTSKGPEAYRTISFDAKKHPLNAIDPKDISLSIVRKGDFTIYEAAIPWTVLGTEAGFSGSHMGIGVEVNDRDLPKKDQSDVCGLFLFQTHKPANLGVLCLDSDSKQP